MANYKNNTDNNDAAGLKLAAAVGGVVVVCFCLGYFVIGKGISAKETPNNAGLVTSNNNGVVESGQPKSTKGGAFIVIDRTAAEKAKRKKAADEALKKADEEAKKKADEEAKKKAAQEALENIASPTPTASLAAPDPDDLPDPTASPTPDESPVVDPTPSPSPEATPRPVPSPHPVVTPKPIPSTAPTTPDDPEDVAMSTPLVGTNPAPLGPLYRIRVGSFADKANADTLATQLKNHGYATSLTTESDGGKTIYRLQVGAYRNEKTARDFARVIDKELEPNGLKTTISHH